MASEMASQLEVVFLDYLARANSIKITKGGINVKSTVSSSGAPIIFLFVES